jgi:hypothetical protein
MVVQNGGGMGFNGDSMGFDIDSMGFKNDFMVIFVGFHVVSPSKHLQRWCTDEEDHEKNH